MGSFPKNITIHEFCFCERKGKVPMRKMWAKVLPPFIIGDSTPDRVSTLKHALGALDNERRIATKVNMSYS